MSTRHPNDPDVSRVHTGITPHTYGDATHVAHFTVDATGAMTDSSNWAIKAGTGCLCDHTADAGNTATGETDLYSDTIPAGQLAKNGAKLTATYAGITVAHATATRELRVYFGGTLIWDSTAQVTRKAADNWEVRVTVLRDSPTSVRCAVSFSDLARLDFAGASYTPVTGLTLTNTQVLKITGQAGATGAATNDIVAKMGTVCWTQPA